MATAARRGAAIRRAWAGREGLRRSAAAAAAGVGETRTEVSIK